MEDGGAVAQRRAIFEFHHEAVGTIKMHQRIGIHAKIWPCAVIFSRWLCDHPEVVRDKKVLELGAGIGLVSMVAARLGAKTVVTTDIDIALDLLQENCAANNNANVIVKELLWGCDQHVKELGVTDFDVILGADIVSNQDEATFEQLVHTIKALTNPQVPFYLAYENRHGWWYDHVFFEKMTQSFASTWEDIDDKYCDTPSDDHMLYTYHKKPDAPTVITVGVAAIENQD